MTTSTAESPPTVGAIDVKFEGDVVTFVLSDARSLVVDLRRVAWLSWLLNAPGTKREAFVLEQPGGFAVYWPELDDGVEVAHLLSRGAI